MKKENGMVCIKVLQRDIARGKPNDLRSCPVALATRRARIMPLREVAVGGGSLDWQGRFPFPILVEKFISKFDAGRSVKPISFYVDGGGF